MPVLFFPLLCAFFFSSFFFSSCVLFFLSIFLFIYLFWCLWKLPPVSRNFYLFSVFKLLVKISLKSHSRVWTFSAPLEKCSNIPLSLIQECIISLKKYFLKFNYLLYHLNNIQQVSIFSLQESLNVFQKLHTENCATSHIAQLIVHWEF